MLIRQNNSQCPNNNCRSTKLKRRSPPSETLTCEQCGETWNPTTDGMRSIKVRVINSLSVWAGMVGEIAEILPHSGCNVRVKFPPSRTDTFADIFHPSQLEELGTGPIDGEFSL